MTHLAISKPIQYASDAATAVNNWQCSSHSPGTINHPDQLRESGVAWLPVAAPATAAAALESAGQWSFEQPVDIDAFDWCFCTTVDADDPDAPCVLHFSGLATEAEVWFNGRKLFTSDNMFRSYRCDVSELLQSENELVCIFRSLKEKLARRRPRPRWKTNLVNHQQLRWHRTSLLGRIPGWSPCAPAVGPWREVRFETAAVQVEHLDLRTNVEGVQGVIHVQGKLFACESVDAVSLRVGRDEFRLSASAVADGVEFEGTIRLDDVTLWWPHTHGEPYLYDCTLLADTATAQYDLGQHKIGFRTFDVDRTAGFSVKVNCVPVFCRGACWTTSDLLSRNATAESLEHDLRLARDAGANMLRIGGTMAYESDAFYELCDELGILVWQDFMFANMDYPVDDAAFHDNIVIEATEQISRLARHACVAIYCGSSEIEQQAAMLGLPREAWSNDWFTTELAELCKTLHPGAHYVSSTPTGGALPFHTSEGVTHYYGVGAYLRPASDVRRADVKFTSECLGFANAPDMETCYEIMAGVSPVTHHPRWKARVPRDSGAGWDFEDVRDHYLAELFGVDPIRLRSFDMTRYLQLSRVASGEMMTAAFAEWRSGQSRNSGALVWFFKDLWPSAGWGIVDSHETPKAAYYALKRSWRTRQVALTDEGLNGLDIHLTNETAEKVSGFVDIVLLREPNTLVARREFPICVNARSRETMRADAILGRFHDLTHAYRFGPPQHDVVVVSWYDDHRQLLSQAFHFVRRPTHPHTNSAGIDAKFIPMGLGQYEVALTTDCFLYGVCLKADGYLPDDNYFHLPPQQAKRVRFRSLGLQTPAFAADLEAINLAATLAVVPSNESDAR